MGNEHIATVDHLYQQAEETAQVREQWAKDARLVIAGRVKKKEDLSLLLDVLGLK